MLYLKAGRHSEAAADLRRALASAISRKDQGIIHYNLALAEIARGDRSSAQSNLDQAVHLGHEDAQGLSNRLRNASQGKAAVKQR